MIKRLLIGLIVIINYQSTSYSQNHLTSEISINDLISGTLLVPQEVVNPNLAILISDYGPVDRNGNQNFSNNNALKKLAEALGKYGIASFRYDKRTFKLNQKRMPQNQVSFDDFITDAQSVIQYFDKSDEFNTIFLIGHGQGSLVAMQALNNTIDGFISIGGSANPIDEVIIQQVTMMDENLGKQAREIVTKIKKGEEVTNVPTALNSIFSEDIQPFMASWMRYDPKESIKNIEVPILILNGTKDLQVKVEEAKELALANSNATLSVIDQMNHVLFIIQGNDLENSKSYNESFRTISDDLVEEIQKFIKE